METSTLNKTRPRRTQSHSLKSSRSSTWYRPSRWDESEEPDIKPGLIIQDTYRLEEELGKGGMGVVWKATDLIQEAGEARDSYVAIKFLSQDFKKHPDALKALVREFRRYKRLSHSKIVKAHSLGRIGNAFFMVMELLKGIPLNEFIKTHKNGLSLSEAEPIIKDIAQALAYAHQEGIAHLDFKPANVFYDPEAKIAKVIDFGIARPLEQSERDETRFDPGNLGALTDAYASCEMLLGKNPDKRDDIYALACVTYELLSGKHPFNRKKASQAKYDKLSPKPLKELNNKQNKALLRGLAFYQDDRTPTASQFLEELFPKKPPVGLVAVMLLAIVVGFAAWWHFKQPDQKPQPLKEVIPENVIKPQPLKEVIPENVIKPQPLKEVIPEDVIKQPQEEEAIKRERTARLVADELQKCQRHLNAQRLTSGRGGNALACYQKVLKLETGNAKALEGLHQIERRYQDWAESAFQKKQRDKVSNYLKGLEKVNPQSPILADLRQRLKIERENLRTDELRQRVEQLTDLLQKCQKHLNAQRLTSGRGGNALACYQKVLKLETGNAKALEGLHQIERRYQKWAKKAFKKKQLHKVSNYLRGLEKVNPHSSILADLKQRLKKEREKRPQQKPAPLPIKPARLAIKPARPINSRKCREISTQMSLGIEPLTAQQREFNKKHCN